MQHVAREVLLGLWKAHILHHAAEDRVYGRQMLVELRRHGYDLSPGTLYPILRRMERRGWLRLAGAGTRKEYALTRQGAEVLELVRRSVLELHREMERTGPPGAPRARPRRRGAASSTSNRASHGRRRG